MKSILELLMISDHYKVSERVDVAKGMYAIPKTWKESWSQIKRRIWLTGR